LYDSVLAVGMELCPALGIGVPVGKDSLSMRTHWSENGQPCQVTAPVSLIVTAFAALPDVRCTWTPQLQAGDTELILVDLGRGRARHGGSTLAQVLGGFGDRVPDLDDPAPLKALAAALAELRAQDLVLLPRPQRRWPLGLRLRNGLRRSPRRQPRCRQTPRRRAVAAAGGTRTPRRRHRRASPP
jgi:phosphoribosylformylglycinamidine (FGAM) synthase-like enzyme